MKFKKLVGGHVTAVIFIGALVILFLALAKLLSSVEEFSEFSQTTIKIMKKVIGK